jgi:hypothetical protein
MKMSPFLKRILTLNPFLETAILKKDAVKDAEQEVKIALQTAPEGQRWRAASKALYDLATHLGFSRKKGLDSESQGFSEETSPLSDEHYDLLDDMRIMYKTRNMTAREVCEAVGGKYSKEAQKQFSLLWPKGDPRGRKPSKNKTP